MIERYPQAERKLVYRLLQGQMTSHPELMDAKLLDDLQRSLQHEAQAEGVDTTDHAAWVRWLGGEPGVCATGQQPSH
jgi:hypothetical protein